MNAAYGVTNQCSSGNSRELIPQELAVKGYAELGGLFSGSELDEAGKGVDYVHLRRFLGYNSEVPLAVAACREKSLSKSSVSND